eukprot:GHVN01022122.1.p1 GENE.GHVN01022122.1~~GHVN01022122.1.p1  ORF type:complete len:569 (-),score=163.27 GHVN01022122.1:360-2066(-)
MGTQLHSSSTAVNDLPPGGGEGMSEMSEVSGVGGVGEVSEVRKMSEVSLSDAEHDQAMEGVRQELSYLFREEARASQHTLPAPAALDALFDPTPNILFCGMSSCGKTSLIEVVFRNRPPHETIKFEPTKAATVQKIENTDIMHFTVIDYGAELLDDAVAMHIMHDYLLPRIDSIIFVVDAKSEPWTNAIDQCSDLFLAALQRNPEVKLEAFLHKMDGADSTSEERQTAHRKFEDSLRGKMGRSVAGTHLTNIYDVSLCEAVSSVLKELNPSVKEITQLLDYFCSAAPVQVAYLIDVATKTFIATDTQFPFNVDTYELCIDMMEIASEVSFIYGAPKKKHNDSPRVSSAGEEWLGESVSRRGSGETCDRGDRGEKSDRGDKSDDGDDTDDISEAGERHERGETGERGQPSESGESGERVKCYPTLCKIDLNEGRSGAEISQTLYYREVDKMVGLAFVIKLPVDTFTSTLFDRTTMIELNIRSFRKALRQLVEVQGRASTHHLTQRKRDRDTQASRLFYMRSKISTQQHSTQVPSLPSTLNSLQGGSAGCRQPSSVNQASSFDQAQGGDE